jgi:membrane protein DedA with SNARE-associated domain
MPLESVIQDYGYWAVVVGCILEGESVLLLAGFAAHQGYLQIELVIFLAFLGALAGDQTYFWLGRWRGPWLLAKRPKWRARVERVQTRLGRAAIPLMVGFRFLYGLRTATPLAVGMSTVPARRFAPLNVAGSALWATVIALLGYFFGAAIEALLGRVKKYELTAFAVLAAVALTVGVVRHLRAEKKR